MTHKYKQVDIDVNLAWNGCWHVATEVYVADDPVREGDVAEFADFPAALAHADERVQTWRQSGLAQAVTLLVEGNEVQAPTGDKERP